MEEEDLNSQYQEDDDALPILPTQNEIQNQQQKNIISFKEQAFPKINDS